MVEGFGYLFHIHEHLVSGPNSFPVKPEWETRNERSLTLLSRGIASAFGVFQLFYEKELLKTTSISSISWVGSVQAFLLVVVGVFAGPLFDLGYLRSLLVVGNFLIILGMFMLSLSTEYYQVFLAQGICFGLGSGMLYVPAMALVATEFTTKRAVAVGLASTGSSIGSFLFTLEHMVASVPK